MSRDHLFVFGTLLSGYDHPMARMLAKEAELLGEARCRGKLYLVKHYPGIVLSDDPADVVFGELLRMRDVDSLLAKLDRYEGCAEGAREPTEYIRRIVTVTLASGEPHQAWTYIYNWPVAHLPRIGSGRFLEHVAAAKQEPPS